jgi:hypothetical protein
MLKDGVREIEKRSSGVAHLWTKIGEAENAYIPDRCEP